MSDKPLQSYVSVWAEMIAQSWNQQSTVSWSLICRRPVLCHGTYWGVVHGGMHHGFVVSLMVACGFGHSGGLFLLWIMFEVIHSALFCKCFTDHF